MKKIFKGLTIAFAMVGLLVLASCSKVSQSYADKINKAAEKGEHITLSEVRKDLGDEALEAVDSLITKSGIIIAVKGCKSIDDLKAKADEGKDVEGIVITIALDKATAAKYGKISAEDIAKLK